MMGTGDKARRAVPLREGTSNLVVGAIPRGCPFDGQAQGPAPTRGILIVVARRPRPVDSGLRRNDGCERPLGSLFIKEGEAAGSRRF